MWIRPGHAGYVGPALSIDPHSTSIGCLAVGLDGPFDFAADSLGTVRVRSGYSPARIVHHLPACEGRMLYMLVDPLAGQRCMAEMRRSIGPFGFEHRNEDELVAAGIDLDIDRIIEQASIPAPSTIDPRIAKVARIVRDDPAAELSAEEAAALVGVSTSHLLRTFSEQTGTTFRRYRQWARMLSVARGFTDGHDLTRCAVDAGFASLSHFSENFHRMFGLSATALLATGVRFDFADHGR
ncbi:helix-turn-helix domain-containing protein [Nocardia transvalensis]|uniref:helix-turn-helix domain-containing protein n=1 Tax=Nocardia transvalensis TaxID=37333 RepID=UPI00189503B7|nr:helix-turn-helix domain-containing protein [Nocardia transvalensis]MBF6331673.1 AraC family transcriptional regulator [Nocardia transvalensis]